MVRYLVSEQESPEVLSATNSSLIEMLNVVQKTLITTDLVITYWIRYHDNCS